jgi:hypothetical protein
MAVSSGVEPWILNGGIVVVVVGGVVVVVDELEVVAGALEVVVDPVSALQAATRTTKTSRRQIRRYMVDLGVIVRSPSRDLIRTLTV